MVGVVIILVILLAIMSVIGFVCWKNALRYHQMLEEYAELYGLTTDLEFRKQELRKEIDTAEFILSQRREEICRTNNSFSAIQTIQQTKLAELLKSLNDEIATKRLAELEIDKAVKDKQQELEEIDLTAKHVEVILASSKNELTAISDQLTSLKRQHKEATARLDDECLGRMMSYTDDDVRLTQTLEVLKLQYPFLSDAFAKIQWSNIWQVKFQAMTNDLLKADKQGIYRIFTVVNGIQKSYIGQAKHIRERWSQHIKKMLGVERADNSKLYNAVKPWDAHFEIVEECSEAQLNVKERYWIDYYNGVENGYNIRT